MSAKTAGGVNGKGEWVVVGVVRQGPKDERYENRMAISEVKVVEGMCEPGSDGQAQVEVVVESNEMTGKGCRQVICPAGSASYRCRGG
jgi:hypothetical protein